MKSKIKILSILLLMLVIGNCKRQEESGHKSNEKQTKTLGKTAGPCTCSTRQQSNCNDECTKEFMNNLDIRRFRITWESCDNNDLDGGCRGSQAAENPSNGLPYTSDVVFCYQDWVNTPSGDCMLGMQIDFLPPCLKCITGFPRCIKFRAYCQEIENGDGTSTFTLSLVADDPDVINGSEVNGYKWTLTTVTGDPKIKICCEKMVGNWKTFYCCTGDIQEL